MKWQGDKALIGQVDKQNMTVHRWFADKSCPGDYLYNLHGKIAEEVNKKLSNAGTPTEELKYKVGDVVQFTGCIHYTSSYRGGIAHGCKAGMAKVTAISKGKPHPYCLRAVAGKGSTVYGWVNVTDVTDVTSTKKTIDELAKEIISGKWGIGHTTREKRLREAGWLNYYTYKDIRRKVNELCK